MLTSTGLGMVAALLWLSYGPAQTAVVQRCLWVAVAAIVSGVAVLFLELGYPLRAMYAIPFSFAFSSPLWWKVLFVLTYVVVLVALFFRLQCATEQAAGQPLFLLLLLAALAVTAAAGVVYGSMTMRPFWASGDIPVAFIFESLLGGLAFLLFFTHLAYGFRSETMPEAAQTLFRGPLPVALGLLTAVQLLFLLTRTIVGLRSNAEGMQVWGVIVSSPLYYLEWAALLVTLFLMLRPTRTLATTQALAALLVVVALLIGRYEYIIGGQMVPMFKGSWAPAILSYSPSPTEWALLLMAIFLVNVINAAGEMRFRFSQQ